MLNTAPHWPEYLIEGACLGLFMVSAFSFATLLEHPASVVHQAIPNPLLRRFLMGLAITAPLIGMLSAAEVYLYTKGARQVGCAKLHHENNKRCIFCGKPPT